MHKNCRFKLSSFYLHYGLSKKQIYNDLIYGRVGTEKICKYTCLWIKKITEFLFEWKKMIMIKTGEIRGRHEQLRWNKAFHWDRYFKTITNSFNVFTTNVVHHLKTAILVYFTRPFVELRHIIII